MKTTHFINKISNIIDMCTNIDLTAPSIQEPWKFISRVTSDPIIKCAILSMNKYIS